MKNLEQLGLVALDAAELEQVQGGFWKELKDLGKKAIEAVVIGVVVAVATKPFK